ncbi:MAG: sugar phosphate isomerase/epimerase family protein [Kiritimatiellales bacterium]
MIAPPDFDWGISSLGCHELDLESVCRLADRNDIHFLEIRSLEDCLDLPGYLDRTFGEPSKIQSVLDRYNQKIIALNSGFSLTEHTEEARKDLLLFAKWADALNIPYIRIFGGGTMSEPLSVEGLHTAVDTLNWWQDLRAQNEWTTNLALETHDGFSSGKRCRQLQDAVGFMPPIIWDTHHTWKAGCESAEETWRQIGPHIKHVHIKDSISVPSARHPYTYVLPGQGEFPARETLALLQENGYAGVVSLEWERKWHPYLPDLDTALNALETSGWRVSRRLVSA